MQKEVKTRLKVWSKHKNNLQKIVDHCRNKCEQLQLKLDEDSKVNNAQVYYAAKQELHNNFQMLALSLRQKAKCNWIVQADEATKFFYAKLAKRNDINTLSNFVNEDSNIPKTDTQLCEEALHYFEQIYNSEVQNRVFPKVVCKNQVSECGKIYLNQDISIVEVKFAIFSVGIDKAPVPDGFFF